MNAQKKLILAGTVSLAIANSIHAQPPGMLGQYPSEPALVGPAPPVVDPSALGLTSPMQPPALPPGQLPPGQFPPGQIPGRPLRRRDLSWIYIDRPKPRKVGVHDIITVVVDEKSEVTQNSRFNRQRNAVYTAQLREWLRINSDGNLDVAATNSPGVNGQLRSQLQSYGQGLSQEGMKYRIAATVVDILPNGTLILEAHKSIRTNSELWEYSLTGRIRSQDVSGNNTVNSENVADLIIAKRETGKIQDSTKRGWLQRTYDLFLPF